MDIAITGASGLIGTALTSELQTAGHRVVRVVRGRHPGADEIGWDPHRGTIDAAGFEGLDAVVHLAGEGIATRRWNDEHKRSIRESRTSGTSLIARTLAEATNGPKRFLSGSAIGIYGDRGDQVLTEVSEASDRFLARVVVDWEAAAGAAVEAGISTAFLRTGIVLDPGGGALGKMLPLFRFGLGGRLGSGRQYWSWISMADEVGAIRFLLERADVTGPVNLTAPTPVTNAAFTRTLSSVLRRPAVFPVPAFGPKLLLGAELAEELLFCSARVDPAVLGAAGYIFEDPTLEGALRRLLGGASATR
ncbi:MAG: TIGR01777 family protein [Actinobacteria bacterium]|nr:TIGR01777 family protein [Actinomycetota bacterium]